jgi:hypothetical protein
MIDLRPLFVVLFAGAAVLLSGGFGCSTLTGSEDGRTVEHLVATVDSLDAPARISPSDTLSVRLRGTVGPNSCYTFDRFDVDRSADRLTVTPVVEHVTKEGTACLTVVIPLSRTYKAAPPFKSGSLTIAVPQPDRPDVTATVEVQ